MFLLADFWCSEKALPYVVLPENQPSALFLPPANGADPCLCLYWMVPFLGPLYHVCFRTNSSMSYITVPSVANVTFLSSDSAPSEQNVWVSSTGSGLVGPAGGILPRSNSADSKLRLQESLGSASASESGSRFVLKVPWAPKWPFKAVGRLSRDQQP